MPPNYQMSLKTPPDKLTENFDVMRVSYLNLLKLKAENDRHPSSKKVLALFASKHWIEIEK
jgi:hypothetical protein